MSVAAPPAGSRSPAWAAAVVVALALLATGVISGVSTLGTLAFLVVVTVAAIARPTYIGWRQLMSVLILIILFIPIRRYALPAALPFQLEPYRIVVALVILGWFASLLVDHRTHFRRTGFEGPLILIVGSAFGSILANPGRVADSPSDVAKKLMFFSSFVLVLYLFASVIRRLDDVDALAKTLVLGGTVVGFFAIVEARTGFNIFDHLHTVIPILHPVYAGGTGDFLRVGAAKLRVFGSAEHPIPLSAALVMLTPLALYLARRYRQRRWALCALILAVACTTAISRTGIVMLVVVVLVYLWLRPRETRRMWPALLPALVVVHFALPGTLGALKQSFLPAGGLVAEQQAGAGQSGSGRLADLGPALEVWRRQPLLGQGYGTTLVVDVTPEGPESNILDDQWLGTLLEVGIVGLFGWLWLFVRAVRRFGAEAKRDESDRGWLLVSITAGIAAYAVGMLTYDALAFIQVTFLLFIFIGLGSALTAEQPTPLAVGARRRLPRMRRPAPTADNA
jgi:O-antigen ligase